MTDNQRRQLLALFEAGAFSRISGKAAHQLAFGNTLVIGKLRDLGLADSRTVHKLGRQWTEYWLTVAGIDQARALARQTA